MDQASAGAFLLCSRDPLGPCGKAILDIYMEDKRAFAASTRLFRDLVAPPVFPAGRCAEARGGGRCRGRVSLLAACQLCNYHQTRRAGDNNIEGARWALATPMPQFRQVVYRVLFD